MVSSRQSASQEAAAGSREEAGLTLEIGCYRSPGMSTGLNLSRSLATAADDRG